MPAAAATQSTDESPAGAAIPEKPGKKKKAKTEERAERQHKKVTNDPVVKRESPCATSESEGENRVKKEIESDAESPTETLQKLRRAKDQLASQKAKEIVEQATTILLQRKKRQRETRKGQGKRLP